MTQPEVAASPVPLLRVLEIARAQRAVLFCILANLLATFLVVGFAVLNVAGGGIDEGALRMVDSARSLVTLVVVVAAMVYVYRLAKALKGMSPVLAVIAMLIPCANLITLVVLSMKATTMIRGAGFQVGLMGADIEAIQARLREPRQG